MTRGALLVLVLVVALAHADKADKLFKKGKKLLADKKYAEACDTFDNELTVGPRAGHVHCCDAPTRLRRTVIYG